MWFQMNYAEAQSLCNRYQRHSDAKHYVRAWLCKVILKHSYL